MPAAVAGGGARHADFEILVQLIQADIRLATPPPGTPFASHDAHFIPGEQEHSARVLFNQAILRS